jgi:hypothetical protein
MLKVSVSTCATVLTTLTRTTAGTSGEVDDDREQAAVPDSSVNKRPISNPRLQEMAKKQATPVTNEDILKMATHQALSHDSNNREKLIVLMTLPGHIARLDQLNLEFVKSSNGNRMIVWIPRGSAFSDMDIVKSVLGKMKGSGITEPDAIVFARALEAKMMDKRSNMREMIMDPCGIVLEKACDANKMPCAAIYRKDGDTCLCIVLDVPSLSSYGAESLGNNEIMEF